MKKTFTIFVAVVVAGLLPITAASVDSPPAFVTFGDSLADNGNDYVLTRLLGQDPAVPPSERPHRSYYDGRFSNGPVAFEYLWTALSGRAVGSFGSLRPFMAFPVLGRYDAANFAFGGSRTGYYEPIPGSTMLVPGVRAQIQLYKAALLGRTPVAGTLYGIVSGANDYLVLPPEQPADPAVVVGNIASSVRELYALGGRKFIVLNLPDLGQIPLTQDDPSTAAALSVLTQVHNTQLAYAVANLRAELRKSTILLVDVNRVLRNLPASTSRSVPALEVLVGPGASLCLFGDPATCVDTPTFKTGLDFLFWDAEHPTTGVHKRLATYIYALMAS